MTKMTRLQVVVSSKTVEAENVCSYELRTPDGSALPGFTAGSHIDVFLPGGLVRQYSMCNVTGDTDRYFIAVLNEAESRGGSRAIHESVHAGDRLEIGTPRNNFELAADGSAYLLFAGGIGITPIMAMAQELHRRGANFRLFYFSRSPASMAFRDQLRASPYSDSVHFHFDTGGEKISIAQALGTLPSSSHVYVCGPEGFIGAVVAQAKQLGFSGDRIVQELFAPSAETNARNQDFVVRLQQSGREIPVGAQESIVQALAQAGIDIPTSCQQGVCGTCLTNVLAGECDHRDLYLTDDEKQKNDQILPCCSRSKSAVLVLDL